MVDSRISCVAEAHLFRDKSQTQLLTVFYGIRLELLSYFIDDGPN